MTNLILIAHNLRSSHNVGSILRTAEGLGVERVYLTGYTPYPSAPDDKRLPHIAKKLDRQIAKTALGAENSVNWHHQTEIKSLLASLREEGFQVVGLEQTPQSLPLSGFTAPDKLVMIVGREVEGIEPEVLALCDKTIEIPMRGSKESFNVVQATAMALYHISFLQ